MICSITHEWHYFFLVFSLFKLYFPAMGQHHTVVLSTVIDSRVKKALTEFCRRRGLKVRYVVEEAILEQLEDAVDLAAYQARRDEETIPLEDVLHADLSR